MKRRYKILIGVAVVLVLLAAVFCWFFFGKQPIQENAAQDGAGGWMADLNDLQKLSAVNLPGTHDSCAWNSDFAYFSQCQSSDIATQLNMGIRYMDIRINLNDDKTKLVMTHSIAVCREGSRPLGTVLSFDKVLEDSYAFLAAFPTETIVFCVKPEGEAATCKALLFESIAANPDRWYTKNAIPTLGEVRGKIVLASRFSENNGVDEGLQFLWEEQDNTDLLADPFSVSPVNGDESLYVQDRYCYALEDKWQSIAYGFDEKALSVDLDSNVMLQFLSTKGTGKLGHPYKYAKDINLRLLEMTLAPGNSFGWVIMDFAQPELVKKIIETNIL